ncbi:hypothetical protein BD779DRAFT_1476310 [Infundibulicybe gibba]|nr:hypothetical protein BD779DRAFT_1476310 [Infundibulicybe gibba]
MPTHSAVANREVERLQKVEGRVGVMHEPAPHHLNLALLPFHCCTLAIELLIQSPTHTPVLLPMRVARGYNSRLGVLAMLDFGPASPVFGNSAQLCAPGKVAGRDTEWSDQRSIYSTSPDEGCVPQPSGASDLGQQTNCLEFRSSAGRDHMRLQYSTPAVGNSIDR